MHFEAIFIYLFYLFLFIIMVCRVSEKEKCFTLEIVSVFNTLTINFL
jgi:uncharacterized membrane protein